MNPTFWNSAQLLPSIKQNTDSIMNNLIDVKNVIALFPPGCDTETISLAIKASLYARNLQCDTRDISTMRIPTSADIPTWVLDQPPGMQQSQVINNLSDTALRADVIHLNGLDQLTPTDRLEWLRVISQWADKSRIGIPQGKKWPRLIGLLTPEGIRLKDMPKTDVLLDIHRWWGFPSSAELRILCRMLRSSEDNGELAWKESIVSGIASGDLSLAASLWELDLRKYEEIAEHLNSEAVKIANTFDLSKGATIAYKGGAFSQSGADLPATLQEDWGNGRILGSPEFGVEPHPYALARNNLHAQLQQRIWRGQSQLLMPMIDQLRLYASSRLSRVLGQAWYESSPPVGQGELDRLKVNPLDVEYSYLDYRVKYSNGEFERAGLNKDFIRTAAEVRNDLCHYKSLQWETFRKIYQQWSG